MVARMLGFPLGCQTVVSLVAPETGGAWQYHAMVIYQRSDRDVNRSGAGNNVNVGGVGEDHCVVVCIGLRVVVVVESE
jgi:hypothetical protein